MYRKIVFYVIGCYIILSAGYVFANSLTDIEQAKTVIKAYVTAGKNAEATDAYQKLITDFADSKSVSSAAYDIAEFYRDSRKYSESIGVYKDVIDKWPTSRQAVFAQKGVVVSNIALGKMADAQAELDNLKKNYSADPNIAEAVFNVADSYYWFNKFNEAEGVYKYVLANYPKSDFAIWSQMGLAILNIAKNDDKAADVYTKTLINNFSDNPKLPEALLYIASRYDWDKKTENAKQVYEYVSNNYAKSTQARTARLNILRINTISLIDNESDSNVISSVNLLINEFRDNPDLYDAVFKIGDAYFDKGRSRLNSEDIAGGKEILGKAINVYDKVLSELPYSKVYTWKAYGFIGFCYYQQGSYQKAIRYLEKIPNDSLGYDNEKMWQVNLNLAQSYDQLSKSGEIGHEVAAQKINQYGNIVLKSSSNPLIIKTIRDIIEQYK